MSSPLGKLTPTRRGTLNLGLRRKSSAASLAPSNKSTAAPSANGNENGKTEDTADDNASISSKTDKRPVKKRMFSLLATRASKSHIPSDPFTNGDGPASITQEPSEVSESGSDAVLNQNGSIAPSTTGSLGSSFFSTKRLSGGSKIAAEAEKKRLEDQIQTLTSERSALEAGLQSASADVERLTAEAEKNTGDWDAEKKRIQEESEARLAEKDSQLRSLSETFDQLKEELAQSKAAEEELAALKVSTTLELGAKLAEQEERVREEVKQEKESLETKLTEAQTALDAKDESIKGLEGQVSGLHAQLATAQEELKKLKEASEALAKKETELQAEVGKLRGAGCWIM